MALEEDRERTSLSPAKRGWESRAERREGRRLPEAWEGLLGIVDRGEGRGGGAVYPNHDDVLED